MQKPIRLLFAVAALSSALSAVVADDGGWKMPNLNPFSTAAQPPTSARRAAAPTSGWKMPKLWQTQVQPKSRPHQPSSFNRATSSTQSMLSKTADALNPFEKKQPAPPPKLTGSNSIFTNKSTTTPPKKDAGVKPASWWSSDKAGQKDKTVNEFLSHPRLD